MTSIFKTFPPIQFTPRFPDSNHAEIQVKTILQTFPLIQLTPASPIQVILRIT